MGRPRYIAVDDDINIRHTRDIAYALATRKEASRDVFFSLMPSHEYLGVGRDGIRAKVGDRRGRPLAERAGRCRRTGCFIGAAAALA